jgi:hypothetical protein
MTTARKLHALRGDEPAEIVEAKPAQAPRSVKTRESAAATPLPLKEAPREERPLAAAIEDRALARDLAQAQQREERTGRRLNINEKLAEGRGFWRGVVTGGAVGLAAGVAAAVAAFGSWAPVIQDVAKDMILFSSVLNENEAVAKDLANR